MTRKLLCSSLLLATGLAVVGCGSQVRLKNPATFTREAVKLHAWEDRCSLQSWFDSQPPANDVVMEVGGPGVGPDGKRREVGTTTHRIRNQRQRRMLRLLLQRYYQTVPEVARQTSLTMTVSYYRYCDRARMVRGSEIRLDAGGRTALLAYHPCLGEFLLNRDLYATRRLHVETELAVRRPR